MRRPSASTEVLTIRVPRDLSRRLSQEARRQSLLVRRRASESEAIRFIAEFADLRGWE